MKLSYSKWSGYSPEKQKWATGSKRQLNRLIDIQSKEARKQNGETERTTRRRKT